MPAVSLVVASAVCVQSGQAFGKTLFGAAGPAGVVTLRLGIAAALLLALHRPGWPSRDRLPVVLGFGCAIAGMNLIYPALVYLPLGVASTIQLLGPLTVAMLLSRRGPHLLFCALAGAGVWLCQDPASGAVTPVGVLLALCSAMSMGGYVLLSRRAGADSTGGGVLAQAVAVAALLALPFGAMGGTLLRADVLLTGAAVAVLTAVLPYSLEFAALRRLPARVVGVLLCLEPAVAGVAGFVVLSEELGPTVWVGIACVTAAAAGISATATVRDGAARKT